MVCEPPWADKRGSAIFSETEGTSANAARVRKSRSAQIWKSLLNSPTVSNTERRKKHPLMPGLPNRHSVSQSPMWMIEHEPNGAVIRVRRPHRRRYRRQEYRALGLAANAVPTFVSVSVGVAVVNVQERNDVATGTANAFVHRLMRTAIRLRNNCEMRKSLQQSERRIGRCAIDDDVLNIRIALPQTLSIASTM